MGEPSTPKSADLVVHPPTGTRRRLANVYIALFLSLQILVPLGYYARYRTGENVIDERFSWRFFSSVSLRRHDSSLEESVDPTHPSYGDLIPLATLLKVSSIKKLLGTHHPDIVEKFLRWRCAHPAVTQVRYRLSSTSPDGTQLEPVRLILDAATGGLRRGASAP